MGRVPDGVLYVGGLLGVPNATGGGLENALKGFLDIFEALRWTGEIGSVEVVAVDVVERPVFLREDWCRNILESPILVEVEWW